MAAPSYVARSTGATDAGGVWTATCDAFVGAGEVIIFQLLQDGSTNGVVSFFLTGTGNIQNLLGSDNLMTPIIGPNADNSFPVGASGQARQFLFIGRTPSTSQPTINGGNSTSEDVYWTFYVFNNVNTGTALSSVIESAINTYALIDRTEEFGSTTAERLAQSFVLDEANTPTTLRIKLAKVNSPTDNVIVELQSDSGSDTPSGTVLSTIATITGSTLPADTPAEQVLNFGVSLSAGTKYWLVIRRSGSTSNVDRYVAGAVTSGGYTRGLSKKYTTGSWATMTGEDIGIAFSSGLSIQSEAGTSASVADADVSTNGPDRLALNFIGINDDNNINSFVGQSGGSWALPTYYAESSGTDASIGIQYCSLASAGTIGGGSFTQADGTDGWGTVGFALIGTTPSSQDYTDSATVVVDLQASGTDLKPTEYTDAITIPLDLVASGTDIREIPDTATVYVDLTVSATEVYAKEYTDSATPLVDLQASGAELQEFVESATAYVDLQSSGADLPTKEYTDSSIVYADLQASSTSEVAELVDGDSAYVDIQASGTELPAKEYVDASTVLVDLQDSGTETREISDSSTALIDLQSSGTEIREIPDSSSVYVDLQSSATEVRDISDTNTAYVVITASSVDIAELVDTQVVGLLLSPVGTEFREVLETGEVYLDLASSGTETTERAYLDSAEAYLDIQTSATDTTEMVESGSIYLDIVGSGTDLAELVDTASAGLVFAVSTLDITEVVEAATAYLDLQASGLDEYARAYADTDTAYFDLQVQSIELAEFVDSASAYLDLSVDATEAYATTDTATVGLLLSTTAVELAEFTEADTAYVDLQVSGTEGLFLAPQIGRPDADVTTNNWQVVPLYSKISDLSNVTYIYATAS